MDQFYSLVTGCENAFYSICMVLPEIIKRVVEDEGDRLVPHDVVYDQLSEIAKKSGIDNDNLSFAMAVYMLGFSTYKGFVS